MSHIDFDESTSFVDKAGLTHHRFVWPDRALTVNQAVRAHWRTAAAFTAAWRHAFALMAKGCVPLEYCDVYVSTTHGSNRHMDTCANALAVKAAVDGIVDAKVLPADDPRFVRVVTHLPPRYVKGVELLVVELVGPACEADRQSEVT